MTQAGGLLRALSSARQVYALYPDRHPNRIEAVQDILARAQRLGDLLGMDAVLFVARHAFYLGSSLLPRESLSLARLIEGFEGAGVEALEILPDVTADGVDGLVRILLGDADATTPCPGLAINRIVPVLPEEEGLSEVRQTYGLGLELLRQTSIRVRAGIPVDGDASSRLVEKLADHVKNDPAQALMLTSVKSHDEYTYYHMVNVCLLSLAMGYAIGLQEEEIVALGVGALLHDVGKINIPPEVLNHAGALNAEQWRIVQRHPVDGAGLVLGATHGGYDATAAIVLEHHAAFDLSGYPTLSERPHPSVPARMVSVADAYDSVTTNRPYRRAEEARQALTVIQAGSGRGFDPRVVRAFVRLLGLFPIGSLVRLATGQIGVVIRNHESLLARPTIRLVLDRTGTPCPPEELDLSEQDQAGSFRWSVERSIDPHELGLDMVSLLFAPAPTDEAPRADGPQPGLVHEPSFGEPTPTGYVDTHNPAPSR